ncbi:putative GTP-binding protein EngB [Pseudocercospora fuligena]|uniref:Putative GTP-binding protein EngB n=1 Tax=Pseudocercospora fuligena TaxID=685502 RepID=A0A8H6RLS4_9PEZI|nr:putative GTP-binding protein EngB [Pseudocercospora fuligena]
MDLLRLSPSLRRSLHLSIRGFATTQHAPTEQVFTLTPSTLNSYTVSHPPNLQNLRTAASFFQRTKPELLFTTPHFRSFPLSPFPEVTFLGRSNVGKSSLLNALFGRPNENIAHVSKRPGKTVTMNAYGVGGLGLVGNQKSKKVEGTGKDEARWKRWSAQNSLLVVDMPGYGSGSREEWGKEIMKYLLNRKQLRRTYVLIDAEHGLKTTDLSLLLELRKNGVAHQIVLSKADKILFPYSKAPSVESLSKRLGKLREMQEEIRRELDEAAQDAGARAVMGGLLCCSSAKSLDPRNKSRRIGIDELRWSVLEACGLQDQEALKKGVKEDIEMQEGEDARPDTAAFAPIHAEEDVEEHRVNVH